MQSVYLETTVIGNIAGPFHPDLGIAVRQSVTRRWWDTAPDRYELFVSALVIDECNGGDPTAAAERLVVIAGLPLLKGGDDSKTLADLLLNGRAVPQTEPRDATLIAIAAVNGIELLATWNFKHILNPATQHLIDSICRDAGYEPATICTPEQLLEAFDDT